MAFGKTSLRVFKWLYWIFFLLLHIYLIYVMFVNNRAILAILWAIAGLILIYVFYFYYFPIGDPGTNWPPYITACPDYLTSTVAADGTPVCIDTVGLNTKLLKKIDPSLSIESATNETQTFDNSGSREQKIDNAMTYGLTWEGVF